MYNNDLRAWLTRRAIIEGIPAYDVDEVVDRVIDKLDRWHLREPTKNEKERRSRAVTVSRGVFIDYRRKTWRRPKQESLSAPDESGGDIELIDSSSRTPGEKASDREQLEILEIALEAVLDPANKCYQGAGGLCLNVYDRYLMRLLRREHPPSLRSCGKLLKRYFARHHLNGCCTIAAYFETHACKRRADIADRMRR